MDGRPWSRAVDAAASYVPAVRGVLWRFKGRKGETEERKGKHNVNMHGGIVTEQLFAKVIMRYWRNPCIFLGAGGK